MACGKGSTSKGNARYSGIIREGCRVSGGGGARCEDEDADEEESAEDDDGDGLKEL